MHQFLSNLLAVLLKTCKNKKRKFNNNNNKNSYKLAFSCRSLTDSIITRVADHNFFLSWNRNSTLYQEIEAGATWFDVPAARIGAAAKVCNKILPISQNVRRRCVKKLFKLGESVYNSPFTSFTLIVKASFSNFLEMVERERKKWEAKWGG
jgi:hypothetical protein